MNSPDKHFVRTRIAPTPSGFLHLGNVLSFCITAALSRSNNAKILLRIDDLDQQRVNGEYLQDIFDTLTFLDIPWDEGPRDVKEFNADFSQVCRIDKYEEALKQLADNDKLFACNCSRSQLIDPGYTCICAKKKIPLREHGVNWRLVTSGAKLTINNYDGKLSQATLPDEMKDFVVRRKDGLPAYQLASVIDDLTYNTDLVVRGDDLWPSTLAQLELANALKKNNFNAVTFYHHPLLNEASGQKLSKSAGAASVRYLRQNGKTPADIYTLIAHMLGIERSVENWQELSAMVIK